MTSINNEDGWDGPTVKSRVFLRVPHPQAHSNLRIWGRPLLTINEQRIDGMVARV